jgi:hypothetical protein
MTLLDTFKIHSPFEAHHFIEKVVIELLSHKVSIIASEEKQVSYGNQLNSYCSGYFNDEPLTFAVALNKPFSDWFLVFIHEYCHFKQYLENPEQFHQQCLDIEQFFNWLDGQDLAQDKLEQYLIVAKELESDCEKKVLANLKTFHISELINPEEYAQKANSYINFYNYVAKHRKWYSAGKEPYSITEVWQSFPKKIMSYSSLTIEQEKLFSLCA